MHDMTHVNGLAKFADNAHQMYITQVGLLARNRTKDSDFQKAHQSYLKLLRYIVREPCTSLADAARILAVYLEAKSTLRKYYGYDFAPILIFKATFIALSEWPPTAFPTGEFSIEWAPPL